MPTKLQSLSVYTVTLSILRDHDSLTARVYLYTQCKLDVTPYPVQSTKVAGTHLVLFALSEGPSYMKSVFNTIKICILLNTLPKHSFHLLTVHEDFNSCHVLFVPFESIKLFFIKHFVYYIRLISLALHYIFSLVFNVTF